MICWQYLYKSTKEQSLISSEAEIFFKTLSFYSAESIEKKYLFARTVPTLANPFSFRDFANSSEVKKV